MFLLFVQLYFKYFVVYLWYLNLKIIITVKLLAGLDLTTFGARLFEISMASTV